MGKHADIMAESGLTREQYLGSLRREQPIEELRRKANKAIRLKGDLWTQEELDLAAAEAEIIIKKLSWNKLPIAD